MAFYQATVREADNFTKGLTLPRQKQIPRTHNQHTQSHQYVLPQDYFWQQYFEVIDLLMAEMEKLLLDSCNRKVIHPSASFQAKYIEVWLPCGPIINAAWLFEDC